MATTSTTSFRDVLRALGPTETPLVTAYFDLRPAGERPGTPPAQTVLNQTLLHEQDIDDIKRKEDVDSLKLDHVAIAAAIDEALEEGAHGLLYIGSAGDSIQQRLTTPLPFRFVVRTGDRPYLFEFERYLFLYQRPVTLVEVQHNEVNISRIVLGNTVSEHEHSISKRAVSRTQGRITPQRGMTIGGSGKPASSGSMHAWTKIEESIEAHRHQFQKSAASEVEDSIGDTDIVVVSGPVEPRSALVNELPDTVRVRLIEADALEHGTSERELRERAAAVAERQQFMEAEEYLQPLLDGARPEQTALGPQVVNEMLTQGRIDTIVFHENIAGHYGTADDARHHEGRLPADEVEALLHGALDQSSSVRFSQSERLLDEYDGVAAWLRW